MESFAWDRQLGKHSSELAQAKRTITMPRVLQSATVSFGLVTIPVRLYTAASSESLSYNLIHEKCGSRIRQQQVCPTCNIVVTRDELVKGYELSRDRYVHLRDAELESLEHESSQAVEITEFVPLDKVDPVFFEKTYYVGPGKGGEKPYRLLAEAMAKTNRVAVAQFVMRGKENLVLIRPSRGGLTLHVMYYADEVRNFEEIEKGNAEVKAGELDLAVRLIEGLSTEEFRPEQYRDEYRERALQYIHQKAEGKEITVSPRPEPAVVVDLMEALKASLSKTVPRAKPAAARARRPESASRKAHASRR
jgi:DNA end-binding protein Ku